MAPDPATLIDECWERGQSIHSTRNSVALRTGHKPSFEEVRMRFARLADWASAKGSEK